MSKTEQQIQFHPAADIRDPGQREPILLILTETLLDGRNCYPAGLEIGIESLMRTWEPKGESEVAIVLSLNLHRRHLTSSQRACVAVSILPHLEAQDQAQERERIRKSADATPEKSPGSEKGEMVPGQRWASVRRSHRGGDRGGEPRTQPKTET